MHRTSINNMQVITKSPFSNSASNYYNFNRFPIKVSLQKILVTKKLKNRIDATYSNFQKLDSFDFNEIRNRITQAQRHQYSFSVKSQQKSSKKQQRNSKQRQRQKQIVQKVPQLVIQKQPLRFYTQYAKKWQNKKLFQNSMIIVKRRNTKTSLDFGPVSKSLVLTPNPYQQQHQNQPEYKHLTQIDSPEKYWNKSKENPRRKRKSLRRKEKTEESKGFKRQGMSKNYSNRSQDKIRGWDVRYMQKDIKQIQDATIVIK